MLEQLQILAHKYKGKMKYGTYRVVDGSVGCGGGGGGVVG